MDECEEAYRFLSNFDTRLMDQLWESRLIEPRWTLLEYRRYEFEPGLPVTHEILADFIECAPQFVDIADRYGDLLDEVDPLPHQLPIRELCARFEAPLVARETVRHLRYTREVVGYYHYFIQCYLRVFHFDSMDELRDWYRREKGEPSLEDLLDDMHID